MWLLEKMLRKLIRQGRLEITDYDGRVYTFGPGGAEAPIRLRLTDRRAAGHIARYPQLGAGEAYMWGWLVVEPPHDIRDMVMFVTGQAKAHGERALQPQSTMGRLVQKAAAKADSINLRAKARKNAEHTYNLTRRLYELFLDEDRQYTMGYHRDPDCSLEQAQLEKKALIAAKLYIKPGMKILDIGCGWGGFALYLARNYDCEVLGVALAPDQIAFCQERAKAEGLDHKAKFRLIDYRDVEGQFDRITSIGMLEHLGTPHFPEYFRKTNQLLKPDGVMLNHSIGRTGPPGFTDAWTRKYIFPGGYIPALSELVIESERAGGQVMDVEAMRFHYGFTLAEWYNRTVKHREEITAMYDEEFYRMWLFYLAGAQQSFVNGTMVNWQMVTVRDRNALPLTREYIQEEFLRLIGQEQAPVWRFAEAAE